MNIMKIWKQADFFTFVFSHVVKIGNLCNEALQKCQCWALLILYNAPYSHITTKDASDWVEYLSIFSLKGMC